MFTHIILINLSFGKKILINNYSLLTLLQLFDTGKEKSEMFIRPKTNAAIKERIFLLSCGKHKFGVEAYMQTLKQIAFRIQNLMLQKHLTLATAESCTGGSAAAVLTEIAGSSEYFWGSIVSYHNLVKEKVLGVPGEILTQYGAVSPETAQSMAENARRLLQTDLAFSLTGVAGPGGGSPEKPVGLVYIALADAQKTLVKKLRLSGDRHQIRQASIEQVFNLLLQYLLNKT